MKLSLCNSCNCMTKTIKDRCGKCGEPKELESWQIDKKSQERQDKVGLDFTNKAVEKFKPKELDWSCRFHPTDWFHEVGCPHKKWTKKQLQEALETSKQSNHLSVDFINSRLAQQRTKLLEEILGLECLVNEDWDIDFPGEKEYEGITRDKLRNEIKQQIIDYKNK